MVLRCFQFFAVVAAVCARMAWVWTVVADSPETNWYWTFLYRLYCWQMIIINRGWYRAMTTVFRIFVRESDRLLLMQFDKWYVVIYRSRMYATTVRKKIDPLKWRKDIRKNQDGIAEIWKLSTDKTAIRKVFCKKNYCDFLIFIAYIAFITSNLENFDSGQISWAFAQRWYFVSFWYD